MTRRGAIALLLSIAWLGACRKHVHSEPAAQNPWLDAAAKVSLGTGTPAEDDGQWTMPAKDYANTRYSRLTQITPENVKDLKLVWSQKTGVEGGHEAAPLVVGRTMYVVTPFPNHVLAFDLEKPGSPPKWTYEPKPVPAARGVACCDLVNRGMAFWEGRIYMNTLDDFTIALDAATGAEVWRTKLGEVTRGETITMAPLVVKGHVLVGNSGGEMGVRGWLTALDAKTGSIAWRAWSTGPDRDVLIGPEFKPHYASDRGADLGVRTWPVEQWRIGGGTVWGFVSYDPELDLIYYGTANPGPWNHEARPGDNKWTAGIFARRPSDGAAIWFYQWSPHDVYDHDGVNENVLFDATSADAKTRKVLAHADRNGYVYVLDRVTGEVLSAAPFVHVSSSNGVDLASGRPNMVAALAPTTGKVTRNICPASAGGKDWQPMSFSPHTGLLYIPHQNLCMDEEGLESNYVEGTPYVGANTRFYPGPGGHRGVLTAWNPMTARKVWSIDENFPVWSGTVATATDVVFYGTMDGWFKAVHARTGAELWKFKTDSGVIGQPVTYRGPDGKQYIAVLDGVGGWAGAVVSNDLDPLDGTGAIGFVHAMADLKNATKKGGAVYVFALP
ncbi:methanol/ethanol family PQQ-dependent dehydrogenase [Pendulispora brunnea]|uniref:Methanol/ethanol family PQQ-dependent dehydrogenase n=1 Tax=Pendulispora brunnea TaxID=2905690 RepID=A0ABZ2K9M2_9BACT